MGVLGLNTVLSETNHFRHLLFLFLSKDFGHPSSREQCNLCFALSAGAGSKDFWF